MPWRLETKRAARRDLDDLSDDVAKAVVDALDRLRNDPGSVDLKKLAGRQDVWRVRVGQWRIILRLDTQRGTITVQRILHRRDAYR